MNNLFLILLSLVALDSAVTNYLLSIGATELNPLMVPFAGTLWLPLIKIGWVLLMWGLITFYKNRINNHKIIKGKYSLIPFH